jgi:excisionase family DNA binding protein
LKAEFTFPQEFVDEIADRIVERLMLSNSNNARRMDDVISDVDGVANYLRVTKQWVYERVHQNTIPYYKLGKYPRFQKSKIDEWLQKMERGNGGKPSKTVRRLLEDVV